MNHGVMAVVLPFHIQMKMKHTVEIVPQIMLRALDTAGTDIAVARSIAVGALRAPYKDDERLKGVSEASTSTAFAAGAEPPNKSNSPIRHIIP